MANQKDCELLPLYEGSESYIFISYSHKDMTEIYPVMEWLTSHGYRVWYDQGIHPGTDWPEVVAGRLRDCEVFLVFLSGNYMQSQNCIRELHYAVSKRKKFLTILLEDVEMTPGVEMQIGISQAIPKHSYQDRQFYQALSIADVLPPCHVPEPEPEISASSGPEPPSAPPPAATAVREKPEEKVRPQAAPPKPKGEKKAPAPRWLKFVPLGLAAAVLLVILVSFAVGQANTVVIAGEKYKKNTTSVTIQSKEVDRAELNKLKKLERLDYLYLNDCTVTENGYEVFSELSGLSGLTLCRCEGVDDYSFLSSMTKLFSLRLEGQGLKDGSLPEGLALGQLSVLSITDSPALTALDVTGMPNLTRLSVEFCGLTELGDIPSLQKLTVLDLSDNRLTAVDRQLGCLKLAQLDLSRNAITDVSGLSGLTVLTDFYMDDNSFGGDDSILFLRKSAATLERVGLSGNSLSQEQLDGALGECQFLKRVDISGSQLSDLSFLSACVQLDSVTAKGCGLESLRGLEGSVGTLTELIVSDNRLTSLSGIPALKEKGYLDLDLRSNNLTTLREVPVGSYLHILAFDNPLKEVGLPEGLEVSRMGLTWFDGMGPDSVGDGCKLLYVSGMPADRKVAFSKESTPVVYYGTVELDSTENLE